MIGMAIIALILIAEWISAYFIGGIVGVVSWWGILGGSLIGILVLFILFVLFIIKLVRRKKVTSSFLGFFLLFMVMAWPFCWFLNIGSLQYPAKIEHTKPQVSIYSPFSEDVIVGWGGDTMSTNNPHVKVPFERWAYDLIMKPHSIHSKKLTDYGVFNKEIISPVKGTIIGVYDQEKDSTPGKEEKKTMMGNYIFIKIQETKTYLVLAHIKKDSIMVKEGQLVDVGTPLAKVGNSGSSSEPHLHIHHQRQNPAKTSMYLSEGLPLYFKSDRGDIMPLGGESKEIITPRQERGK